MMHMIIYFTLPSLKTIMLQQKTTLMKREDTYVTRIINTIKRIHTN